MHSMNWLDIVIGAPLVLAIIRGYRSGFVMQIAILIGVVFSVVLAGKISEFIFPYISVLINDADHLVPPLSYIAAFLLITLAFMFFGKAIESLLKAIQINFINKLAGALLSFITWCIAISVILILINRIDSHQILIKEPVRESSYLFEPMLDIGEILVPFLKTKSESLESIKN